MTLEQTAVEAVNAEFYKALESCNLAAMEKVWLHESWVRCVHPGSEILVGWPEIRRSWVSIFGNTHGMKVSLTNIFIKTIGDFAWVECTENIATFFEQGFTSGQAQTTNIYLKV
ncbi:MAG: nuclear transport factor 2 family protein, partial [Blastocatellia bacterium]